MGYHHICNNCGSTIDDDTNEIVKGKGCSHCDPNKTSFKDYLCEKYYADHIEKKRRRVHTLTHT